jgi:hypothetical protein
VEFFHLQISQYGNCLVRRSDHRCRQNSARYLTSRS